MEKVRKEMLEKLKKVKNMEEYNLEMLGKKDDIEIEDIKYLGEVQLEYKVDGKKKYETINVYAVVEGKTIKYYSDDMPLAAETQNIGHKKSAIIPSLEYEKNYEKDNPIMDIIESLKQKEIEEQEKPKEARKVMSLKELEKEKEKEQQTEKNKEKNKKENNIMGTKPKNVIQIIDPHTTYINGLQTVSNAFDISSDVKEIAIAYTEKGDDEALSNKITMYMLDKNGNIIEESNNKKITELFELDNSTGINPTSDTNTRIKLDGIAEKDANRTMARFKSKSDNNLTLSVDKKKGLDHHRVYAGRKARHENSEVEVELDRKDIGNIQTNLKMQRVVDYGDGIDKEKNVNQEATEHVEHGDDKEKIAIKNADGNENTLEICDSPYIPGTEKTWDELSEETGESIEKLQERFEREVKNGKEPKEVVEEIEYDYEMVDHNRDRI